MRIEKGRVRFGACYIDFFIKRSKRRKTISIFVDPFDGLSDLRRGSIGCVGEPARRFAEDGLRPLRAVRFAGVLGFRLQPATRAALPAALPTFSKVAWERKKAELERLLEGSTRLGYALGLLKYSGMLEQLAPELLSTPRSVVAGIERLPLGEAWLRFACWCVGLRLHADVSGEILRRWRVSGWQRRVCQAHIDAAFRFPGGSIRQQGLRRWIGSVGRQSALGAARIVAALGGPKLARLPGRVRTTLATTACLELSELAVSGRDLRALGLNGPAVGTALDHLLACVLDNPKKNSRDRLLRLAHNLSTTK